MEPSPEEPLGPLIATPVGFLTRAQFADYMVGYARRQLVKVYGLQPGQVFEAPPDEVHRLLKEARDASPHLADEEEDDDVVTSAEAAHMDVAAPGLTTHISLGVDTTDPEVRRLIRQLLGHFAQTELAEFLGAADPLVVVSMSDPDVSESPDSAGSELRLQITTSDDDTADALLELLEELARDTLRPAVDAAHPGRIHFNLRASDGLSEWY